MSLSAGTRLGHYEVLALLGAGGMGEVYRARDTKLGRDVAMKVLPEAFVSDAERMARLQREAHVLASLSHPCIAPIYGLEEQDGRRALVMELVEGPTLAERLAQGALPLEEALPIAKQVAEALECAHERGVVHRDLKPANLKVTPDGTVKVLDFGLAKAIEASAGASSEQSPTLSALGTRAGTILGTAAYMAPEQAKGKPVERRADIWSFGVVLFEMLAGQRPFAGETASETLALVMTREPPWETLPAGLPPRVSRLLERCLTKDPKLRLQAIGEARIVIDGVLGGAGEEAPKRAVSSIAAGWRRAALWAVLGGALASTLALTFWAPWRQAQQPSMPLRLSVELGADASLVAAPGASAVAILSPDGAVLAFVAQRDAREKPQIYVRRLDQLQASPLLATEGASDPFFSPDGQWIGFFADGTLKKVAITGGAAITLCDATSSRGGTWAEDGTIFVARDSRVGLTRVPSVGGSPQPLTSLDAAAGELTHRWPQALAGGKAVLFTANSTVGTGDFERANIVVQSLPDGPRRIVQRGGYHGRYLSSGHLVYMHEGTLFAVPFDLERLEPTGQPVPVLEGLASDPGGGAAQFAFSARGTLVFLRGQSLGVGGPIQWMDREGMVRPLRAVPAAYSNVRFSPDGRQLAMDIAAGRLRDVWVYEWARDTMLRLTFDAEQDGWPVWTPDGRRIAFASTRADKATPNLYWQRADGTGEAERLTESKNHQVPMSWHPTGKFLAYVEQNSQTLGDVMILPLEGNEASGWKPGTPTVFLNSPFQEGGVAFSPDGRWLAYVSLESGRPEVYVRPFPGPGGRWQISSGRGRLPTWSRNRKELFYGWNETIMVAPYTAQGDSFLSEKAREWSPGRVPESVPGTRPFDLHPDGQRFAVLKGAQEQADIKRDKVVLILDFFDELRRIAPARAK